MFVVAAVALALAGAGTAYERTTKVAEKKKVEEEKKAAKPSDLYSANPVKGRPVDLSKAETKRPRDGALALNPNDPYTYWPSHRPGNPPRPRRNEAQPWRTREELVNHRDPEMGYSEITGIRDPGRFDVLSRVKVSHSDMWDADGNLAITNGVLDERPSQYEAVWQSYVPATETLGVLNQQRDRVSRESGRCVENMYAPAPSRLFAAEPLGVAGTGGIPTSTKKLDEMVTLTPGLTSIIKMNFMSEGHGGNDRMPGKSTEFMSGRAPTRASMFNAGFVEPQFVVAEKTNKFRETKGRTPEIQGVPVGPVPNTMDQSYGDRANRKDVIGAFDIKQTGASYSGAYQETNNHTKGGFHSGSHETTEKRAEHTTTVIKGAASTISYLNVRPAPMREGADISRIAAPNSLPPSEAALGKAKVMASTANDTWSKSRHEA